MITVVTMNEEFDPTLEIGISGVGMSEEDTQKAVQNIEAADIENGIVEPEQVLKVVLKWVQKRNKSQQQRLCRRYFNWSWR